VPVILKIVSGKKAPGVQQSSSVKQLSRMGDRNHYEGGWGVIVPN